MNRRGGFTLLEVMVALTILAIAATGLISAMGQGLQRSERLETKTYANWIAANRLAEIHAARAWPAVGTRHETQTMAQREWDVQLTVSPSIRPDMRQVMVDVRTLPETGAAPVVSITGFLGQK